RRARPRPPRARRAARAAGPPSAGGRRPRRPGPHRWPRRRAVRRRRASRCHFPCRWLGRCAVGRVPARGEWRDGGAATGRAPGGGRAQTSDNLALLRGMSSTEPRPGPRAARRFVDWVIVTSPSVPAAAAYLDHAATTPLSPAAREAFVDELSRTGNPSSLHAAGRAARRTVEEARESVAAALGARPSEVVFTAGGTEADNLAVKGLFWGRRTTDPRRRRIVVSAVEHHAVLDPAFWMAEHAGAEIVLLPVDGDGRVDLAALRAEIAEHEAVHALAVWMAVHGGAGIVLRPDEGGGRGDLAALRAEIAEHADESAVVSVMWANNEVGTLQPVAEVVQLARPHGIPVHSD